MLVAATAITVPRDGGHHGHLHLHRCPCEFRRTDKREDVGHRRHWWGRRWWAVPNPGVAGRGGWRCNVESDGPPGQDSDDFGWWWWSGPSEPRKSMRWWRRSSIVTQGGMDVIVAGGGGGGLNSNMAVTRATLTEAVRRVRSLGPRTALAGQGGNVGGTGAAGAPSTGGTDAQAGGSGTRGAGGDGQTGAAGKGGSAGGAGGAGSRLQHKHRRRGGWRRIRRWGGGRATCLAGGGGGSLGPAGTTYSVATGGGAPGDASDGSFAPGSNRRRRRLSSRTRHCSYQPQCHTILGKNATIKSTGKIR